jgi:hypothetical protein
MVLPLFDTRFPCSFLFIFSHVHLISLQIVFKAFLLLKRMARMIMTRMRWTMTMRRNVSVVAVPLRMIFPNCAVEDRPAYPPMQKVNTFFFIFTFAIKKKFDTSMS